MDRAGRLDRQHRGLHHQRDHRRDRSGPHLVGAATCSTRKTKPQCDTRNDLPGPAGWRTHGRHGQNLVDFSWNTYSCDCTGVAHGTARHRINAAEQAYFGSSNVRCSASTQHDRRHGGHGRPAHAGEHGRQAGQLPARPARVRRVRCQHQPSSTAPQVERIRPRAGRHRRLAAGVRRSAVRDVPGSGLRPFKSLPTSIARRWSTSAPTTACCTRSTPAPTATDTRSGQEAWAVIPSAVLPNLYKLADVNYNANVHQFYVDGTPVASATSTTARHWHTMLVGGLNAGGKSTTRSTSPIRLAPKALWEFTWTSAGARATTAPAAGNTSDCNLGLTLRQARHHQAGHGTWVVHGHLGLQQRQHRRASAATASATCTCSTP